MAPGGIVLRTGAILFSRLGGAVGGTFFVLTLLGCMNFAIGNRVTEDQNGVLEQNGNVHLHSHAEENVYYPVPYANVPNIELTDAFSRNGFQIVDQKEDHFRVRNSNWFEMDLHWQVRGVRVGLLPPPPPAPQFVSSSPQPSLPLQPEPVH